jgi:hypothetical protein
MAIKTLSLPLTFKYDVFERQVNPQLVQERAKRIEAQMTQVESELNALIEQGFTLWAQEKVESDRGVDLVIILYKPDSPKFDLTDYDHITAATRFLVDREV